MKISNALRSSFSSDDDARNTLIVLIVSPLLLWMLCDYNSHAESSPNIQVAFDFASGLGASDPLFRLSQGDSQNHLYNQCHREPAYAVTQSAQKPRTLSR